MQGSGSEKRFVRFQLPAILWAVLIFISSATPADAFPTIDIWWLPKLVHVVYFFFLCLFVHRALRNQNRYPSLSRWSIPLSLVLTVLYAISDETHQLFVPGRHPEMSDVILDTASGLLFVGSLWFAAFLQTFRKGVNP